MKRLSQRHCDRRPLSSCFCDECSTVIRCDLTGKLERARQRNLMLMSHAGVAVR
jgi:hypothetical protein